MAVQHLVDQNNNFPRLSHLLPPLQMFLSDIHCNSGFPTSCREADDDVLFLQSWSSPPPSDSHAVQYPSCVPLRKRERERGDPVIRQLCLPAAPVQRRSCVSVLQLLQLQLCFLDPLLVRITLLFMKSPTLKLCRLSVSLRSVPQNLRTCIDNIYP